MTKYGTSHFVTLYAAQRYYAKQGDDAKSVNNKIKEKNISIGKPAVQLDERLSLDNDGRYFIEEI